MMKKQTTTRSRAASRKKSISIAVPKEWDTQELVAAEPPVDWELYASSRLKDFARRGTVKSSIKA